MARITLHDTPCRTCGELPPVGAKAPDFLLTDAELKDLGLADFQGKRKLISCIPSVDTPVCALSTRKFNEKAEQENDVVFLTVSADLPFALKRFCASEQTQKVKALSMMRNRRFAEDYGLLIEDGPLAGLCARAVLVLDEEDRVVYRQLVTEVTDEPDYEAALRAL